MLTAGYYGADSVLQAFGLNDAWGAWGAAEEFLNHALVPWLKPPVYLIDVDTRDEALQYAAGGFHASVERGLAGGCTVDPTNWGRELLHRGYRSGGRDIVSCGGGLGRADLRQRWNDVAKMYFDAWNTAKIATPSQTVALLRQANTSADNAYGVENRAAREQGLPPVMPPRDPRTPAAPAEAAGAASKPRRVWPWLVGGAFAAVALTGVAIYAGRRAEGPLLRKGM